MDHKKLYDEIGLARAALNSVHEQVRNVELVGEFRDRICEATDNLEEAQRELIRLEIEAVWSSREEAKK